MFVDDRAIRQWEGATSLSSQGGPALGEAASGSVEDAHPTGADKQPDNDQHDAPQYPAPDNGKEARNHQNNRDNP